MAARPPISCIVGSWLIGVRHSGRTVIAEVLALAEDGYIEVVADDDGYTVRRGPSDPAVLWEDRAQVLAGLFQGGDFVRLRRPILPPLVPPHGPISADRLRTAVSETSERYGFVSWLGRRVMVATLLGIFLAVAAGAARLWMAAAVLGIGSGLLGSGWLQAPVRPSRAAIAERDRLFELRRQLRDDPGAANPALLAWAFLMLTDDELSVWWRRARPVSDMPFWLSWCPVRAGVWPGLLTEEGLDGLIKALAHQVGP